MLEAKWEIDSENGRGWEYTGNIPSLFSDQKTNELEERLRVFIQEGRRTNSDIYQFTLRQSYLPKHTSQIFENWQKNGNFNVYLISDGTKARKNAFYIKYYKPSDPDYRKVYFELK